MGASPPISIGLPVRNGAEYLAEALGDLRSQTFADFELLVSDNGSDDATEEIGRDAASEDPRVTYVRQPQNLGAAANYNFVFEQTTGEYFRWASHDDRCAPTHLEACLRAHTDSGGASLVYPRTLLIDDSGCEIGPYDDNLDLPWPSARRRLVTFTLNWQLCNAIMGLVRREAAARTRLIDTFVSSDVVTLAELAMQGPIIEVPDRLFLRRIHPGSAMQGGNTEVATWLDPNARPGTRFAETSTLPLLYQTLLSISRNTALPVPERVWLAAWVSGAWAYRRTRVNGGLLKHRLLRRDPPGPALR
ncbi:MAG: glycosyltransferase family 2 protein [Microthrixaceae bacterium]